MKNSRAIFVFLGVCLMTLGCKMGGVDPDDITGIDYTNYTTDYSVKIKNNSSTDLIVFKGTVAQSTLMGGVRAKAANHGMKKTPQLFSTTEDFPLVFITEEQYEKNKNNLDVLNNSPFARVYAFYNIQGENNTIYEVSDRFGGNNQLVINNMSNYMVELRRDSVYGEPIGFARDLTNNQKYFLETDDYQLFPVFKKYIPNRDIIQTVYPKYSSGIPKSISFAFGDGNGTIYLLDVKEYLDDTNAPISTGAAYLVINNQSNTGIRLFKGGTPVTNSAGIATINNGLPKTFQIDMPTIPNSSTAFADKLTIGAYTVGVMGTTANIGEHDLHVDTIYTVTVSRDPSSGYFTTTFAESGTVDLDDFMAQ
jgi:hypothetical protein